MVTHPHPKGDYLAIREPWLSDLISALALVTLVSAPPP